MKRTHATCLLLAALAITAGCLTPQVAAPATQGNDPQPVEHAAADVVPPQPLPPGTVIAVEMPMISVDPQAPTVAMYVDERFSYPRPGEMPRQGPQVIVAVWRNGRIVWSDDLLNGGPPYHQGRFEPSRLDELLRKLDGMNAFNDVTLNYHHWPPDSSFTRVNVAEGERWLNMASWHELNERKRSLVQDLDTERVKSFDEKEQHYRRVWATFRTGLESFIPAGPSQPVVIAPEVRSVAAPIRRNMTGTQR